MSANDELKAVLDNVNDLCGHGASRAAAKESDHDQMSIEEIVRVLSGIHKGESTDPEILAAATFHDYNMHHERFEEIFTLQPLLFNLCRERGDAWTKL